MKNGIWVVLLLSLSAAAVFWWVGGLRNEHKSADAREILSRTTSAAPKDPGTITFTPPEDPAPPRITTSVTPGAIMASSDPAQAPERGVTGTPAVGSPPSAPAPGGMPPGGQVPRPPTPAPQTPVPPDALDEARTEAESVALNIRQYRLRFGGNPVGTNAEIVKELDGGNPKTAKYLPTELKRLNEKGELIDAWGTPYFFHQLSSVEMETRSAGPDKILWSTDDVVSK